MHLPTLVRATVLVALLALLAPAPGCSSSARVIRADGSTTTGTLVHVDDDIVVLRNARIVAPRSYPAPFTDRRGRGRWAKRMPEVAIPQNDVVRLTASNRRARSAGIAGSILTGVSLIVLVPSALAYQARGGDSCGDGIFGCDMERAGIGIGSLMLIAGLATGITGWVVYATSYRDEAGEVVPLAPSTSDAALFRF